MFQKNIVTLQENSELFKKKGKNMNEIKSQYTGKITSEHPSLKINSTTKSDITSKAELEAKSEFKDKEEERAAFLTTAKRNAAIMFAKHL